MKFRAYVDLEKSQHRHRLVLFDVYIGVTAHDKRENLFFILGNREFNTVPFRSREFALLEIHSVGCCCIDCLTNCCFYVGFGFNFMFIFFILF